MTQEKPLFSITSGAFHRASCYDDLKTALNSRGYDVVIPKLASMGDERGVDIQADATHFDDVKAIHATLLPLMDQGREIIMVSHSYGSLPNVCAIEGQTKADRAARGEKGGIIGTVTLNGFTFPIRNKSVLGDDTEFPVPPYQNLEDGLLTLNEQAKELFFSGATAAKKDEAWNNLYKYQTRKSMTTYPSFLDSDLSIPKTWVLSDEDQAIPPTWQAQMAKQGGYEDVRHLPTGHGPFLSMPNEVADILVDVAKKTVSA